MNWVGHLIDIWRTQAGEPNAGQIGRVLKPVVDAIGIEKTSRLLRDWLLDGNGKFGPESFARSYRELLRDHEPIPQYLPDGTYNPEFARMVAEVQREH